VTTNHLAFMGLIGIYTFKKQIVIQYQYMIDKKLEIMAYKSHSPLSAAASNTSKSSSTAVLAGG